jgi:UDP:flavonoid glycosyltransferase YjiC (YdhE family)
VNLKSGTPTAPALGAAVDRILADPSFRRRASVLAARIAEHATFDEIESELEAAVRRSRLRLETPVG